jgi:hypothetical protein
VCRWQLAVAVSMAAAVALVVHKNQKNRKPAGEADT